MSLDTFKVLRGLTVENESNSTTSDVLNGVVDPSQAPGVPAPVSSLYTRNISDTDSSIYLKFGLQDTDWKQLASGTESGIIGDAEDLTYTDGLFTDFVPSTKVGVAVDRFNEVLKALAPSPAPDFDQISITQSGVAAKLSFGTSNVIAGYTNVDATAGNSALDINGTYSVSGTRKGAFNTAVKSGVLNDDVTANGQNWVADAFGSGNVGTLKLEVNGSVVHTVDLSTFGSGNSLNANSSGFNLSAATPVKFADGTPFSVFQYRTGTWTIGVADQRNGFNFVRVSHYYDSTEHYSGYYEWVNDPDANALSASSGLLDNLILTGTKQLSGVTYNTGGTAEYDVTISNCHRNIYSTSASAVSFTGTNCSASSSALGNIATETEQEVITDRLVTINSNIRLLNQSISVAVNCDHPIKTDLANAQSQSIPGILIDSINTANTDLIERFCLEDYRLPSVVLVGTNNYASQSDVSGNTWSSAQSLIDAGSDGYSDGLLVYSGAVRYPLQGLDAGDFRNVTDGNANGPSNGPASNPNYSSVTGTRYFYRRFRNNTGLVKANFRFIITGTGSFVPVATGVSAQNLTVEIKFPAGSISTATGWMDFYNDFATNQWSDGDGCRLATEGSGRAMGSSWGGTVGVKSIAANEYIIMRVAASSAWTGSISQISLTWL